MSQPIPSLPLPLDLSRRRFVQTSAVIAAAGLVPALARGAYARASDTIRIGVIGCGGRGTGAAVNALEASPATQIVALADVFPERLKSCREGLSQQETSLSSRAKVADNRCYSGFDAYKQLLASEVDAVILATPPHFRPIHLAAAVDKGKHVFMEKPVAIDAPGVRAVVGTPRPGPAAMADLMAPSVTH